MKKTRRFCGRMVRIKAANENEKTGQSRTKSNKKDMKKSVGTVRPKPTNDSKKVVDEKERQNPDNYCGHCNGFYYDDNSNDDDWMNCHVVPRVVA
jgi:hypothetical protein